MDANNNNNRELYETLLRDLARHSGSRSLELLAQGYELIGPLLPEGAASTFLTVLHGALPEHLKTSFLRTPESLAALFIFLLIAEGIRPRVVRVLARLGRRGVEILRLANSFIAGLYRTARAHCQGAHEDGADGLVAAQPVEADVDEDAAQWDGQEWHGLEEDEDEEDDDDDDGLPFYSQSSISSVSAAPPPPSTPSLLSRISPPRQTRARSRAPVPDVSALEATLAAVEAQIGAHQRALKRRTDSEMGPVFAAFCSGNKRRRMNAGATAEGGETDGE